MSAQSAKPLQVSAAAGDQLVVLERILRGQLEGWRRLLGIIDRQREAVRSANAAAMEQATHEQQHLARTLAMLDQQRERIAAALHKQMAPRDTGSMTLTVLLGRIACDDQQRLAMMTLAIDLRDTIETAKRRSAIVRAAADALGKHMAGIQQSVHSALGRARVYERRGRLNLGVAAPAAVDMRS